MSKTTMILTGAFILSTCIASYAFADSLNQSGVGNNAIQDSYNGGNTTGTNAGGNITNTLNGGSPHSTATAISAPITHNTNTNVAEGGNGGKASASNKIEIGGDAAQKRAPVASAASNFLTSSGDCIGSAGVGAQFVGFGLSGASTTSPADCNRRADAAYWQKAGEPDVAMARMCQDDANRQARHDAGKLCPDETSTKPVKRLSALSPASKGTEFPASNNRFE